MTLQEFTTQLNRLKAVFGQEKYPDERAKLIFKNFRDTDSQLFSEVIDRCIANHRVAPMVQQLFEEASKAREERHAKNKEQHRRDAEAFWQSTYHPEEIKHIVECIRLRMQGKINDSQWAEFLQILKRGAA